MENKTVLIILGIIVLIAVILGVVLASLGNADYTMQGDAAEITVPGNYSFDDENFTAYNGDGVNVTLIEQSSPDNFKKFYAAIKDNGNDSGYQNVTNTTINGYEVYDFAANSSELKNVSTAREVSGNYETWTEFTPEMAASFKTPVDHFRSITYIKDGKINQLLIYTDNPNASLYTPEIDAIINSIAPITE